MNETVGTRIHAVIAALAAEPERPSPEQIIEFVTREWKRNRPDGTTARSGAVRCATSVAVYFNRFAPLGWHLIGSEVQLEGARCDLVWSNPAGEVVVEELKSGMATLRDERVVEQLARLDAGACAKWPGRYVGVRFTPLSSPSRGVVVAGARLEPVATPAGMEVRP